MKKLLFTLLGLFLIFCISIPGERVDITEGPGEDKVDKLFTIDGITVYRFFDGSNNDPIYFTGSIGVIKYKTKAEVTYRTLCNGKI